MGVASQNSTLPCAIATFPVSSSLSLLLAMSGRVFLFFPSRGHEPLPTLRDRLKPQPLTPSFSNLPLCQTPGCRSVHSWSTPSPFPPRPLRTAPSRFPNRIRFGNRPPLIRRSVPAHKSLLVRNVVSMLSHRVISRAWLYEVTRWSGLLRYAPMM